MQIRIKREECCGNGVCVEIAPDVFALDSRHKAVVLDPEAVAEATLREAVEGCPCQAIVLMDNQGNPLFP
jgi:ferredoxin